MRAKFNKKVFISFEARKIVKAFTLLCNTNYIYFYFVFRRAELSHTMNEIFIDIILMD